MHCIVLTSTYMCPGTVHFKIGCLINPVLWHIARQHANIQNCCGYCNVPNLFKVANNGIAD